MDSIYLFLYSLVGWAFRIYQIFILARCVMSWFAARSDSRLLAVIYKTTEPLLRIFRGRFGRFGGKIDLSPVIAVAVVNLARRLVLFFLWILLG
ncbi:MAG: YggT family protein [Peptococcaceae bacterium]|jgi:YggT family protein|nr:YggT family protein [Peptococcaceae bacterium]